MLSRILPFRDRLIRSYCTANIASLRNAIHFNATFNRIKFFNILGNTKKLKDGYDFKPTTISFSIIEQDPSNHYSSITTGHAEPMQINFAQYDQILHQSYKNYSINQTYDSGNIGSSFWHKNNIGFVDFIQTTIQFTNFDKISMTDTYIIDCDLHDNVYDSMMFEYCYFENTHFSGSIMSHVRFHNCHFKNVEFSDLTIQNCSFFKCMIDNIIFSNINVMSDCYFQGGEINNINFINVNTKNIRFAYVPVKNIKINDIERKNPSFGLTSSDKTFVIDGNLDDLKQDNLNQNRYSTQLQRF